MKKWLIFFFLPLALAGCGGSDDDTPNEGRSSETSQANINANDTSLHTEYGRLEMPRLSSSSARVLIYRTSDYGVNYMVEWDDAKRAQRWSCYVLDKITLQRNTERYTPNDGESQYLFDPQLPASAYFSEDPYNGNGSRYEHGHICPSADRLYSAEANKQTFYLTNMQPQFAAFNSGVWLTMENAVRTLANRNGWCDSLFVCKGGTIDDGQWGGYNKIYRTLDNGLVVPRYFFVALLQKKGTNYNSIALWFSQVGGNLEDTDLSNYSISIDELENRTGIDFFCNLPDDTENEVEAQTSTTLWGF